MMVHDAATGPPVTERLFRTILAQGWDVTVLLSAGGEILYASPTVTRMLGYSPHDLLGRSALDLIHPEDAPAARSVLGGLGGNAGCTAPHACRVEHASEGWRWMEIAGTNLLAEPAV